MVVEKGWDKGRAKGGENGKAKVRANDGGKGEG